MTQVQTYLAIGIKPCPRYTYDSVCICIPTIIAQLMLNKQENKNTNCHANSQPKNVDENIKRVLLGSSEDYFEVVFKHGFVDCEMSRLRLL